MVLAKIPEYLQDRWNRNVQKIRRVQIREPGLTKLTNFIEHEMVLVNVPPLFFKKRLLDNMKRNEKCSKAVTTIQFVSNLRRPS